LKDTSNVSVFVTLPSGKQQRVPYFTSKGEKVMEWIPATSQSKRMKINYPAVFSQDGTYSLLVQAADKTGNRSGDNDYKVSFEIVTASSMSYLTNYPNPFSTSTRFVYTLTGSTVPENLVIQILTISGKVVKEITSEELGPLEIGKNKMTAYAWDGKDEFGDPLANGVYLYRVMSKINGQKTSHRATGVDANFTKEFGKMYLLR
jgi:flagellar hook assembly protein FlgD